jgi:hypothetical protein
LSLLMVPASVSSVFGVASCSYSWTKKTL